MTRYMIFDLDENGQASALWGTAPIGDPFEDYDFENSKLAWENTTVQMCENLMGGGIYQGTVLASYLAGNRRPLIFYYPIPGT